jgi:hypothetical protein
MTSEKPPLVNPASRLERVMKAGRAMAGKHLAGFKLIDWHPEDAVNFPGQDPDTFMVDGLRRPMAETDNIADLVTHGRYSIVRDTLAQDPNVGKIITAVQGQIANNGNIIVVTPHGTVTDIAFALKLVSDLLEMRGDTPDSIIMISKMVPHIGKELEDKATGKKFTIPAVQALRLLCNKVYLSWPKTESAKKATDDLPVEEITNINKQVTAGVLSDLKEGKKLVGIAPTGTTQVGEDGLAPFSEGTKRILTAPNTLVLTVVAHFDQDTAYAVIHDELRYITDSEDADKFNQELSDLHFEHSRSAG